MNHYQNCETPGNMDTMPGYVLIASSWQSALPSPQWTAVLRRGEIPCSFLQKSLLHISSARALGPVSWHPLCHGYSAVLAG